MDDALLSIGHHGPRVIGCSRTDSGVHAAAFTAHVDSDISRPAEEIGDGLNAKLPDSIRVWSVRLVSPDFHARFSASGKTYRYHIFRGKVISPFLKPYATPWSGPLDESAMKDAATIVEGAHEFASFTTAYGREKKTGLSIDECSILSRGELLVVTVSGRAFLHKMVRRIVGALLAVGRGRLNQDKLTELLSEYKEEPDIVSLPPAGLILWKIEYPQPFTCHSVGNRFHTIFPSAPV